MGTDLEFMQTVVPDLIRGAEISPRVAQMFRDWHELGAPAENPTGLHIHSSSCAALYDRLNELDGSLDTEALRSRVALSLAVWEGLAVALFHKAAQRLADGPPDPERRINPYAVSVHPERWETDGLFSEDGLTLEEAYARVPGLENMLIDDLVAMPAG
jgi:hypothetical protein